MAEKVVEGLDKEKMYVKLIAILALTGYHHILFSLVKSLITKTWRSNGWFIDQINFKPVVI